MRARAESAAAERPAVAVVARWPVGGIRAWMEYVYADSRFRRYRLTLLLPRVSGLERFVSRMEAHGIETVLCRSSGRGFALDVLRVLSLRRFELVHAHGFSAGTLSALAPLGRRGRRIVTQHDMLLEGQFRGPSGRLTRAAVAHGLRRADVVHAVTGAAAANVRQNFPFLARAPERVKVVCNGIDEERFWQAEAIDVRARYDIGADTFVAGFFGRFMGPKGFRHLVDAIEILAARHPSREVVVLAAGDGGFRAREVRELKARGLAQRFRFAGFTSEVPGLMKGVDAVVMPSLWEACGLVAMEALAAGTPLICSDCPALLELAETTPARIVQKADAAGLAAAILEEMDRPRREQTRAWAAAHRHVFGVAETARGMAALYDSLIPRRGRALHAVSEEVASR